MKYRLYPDGTVIPEDDFLDDSEGMWMGDDYLEVDIPDEIEEYILINN